MKSAVRGDVDDIGETDRAESTERDPPCELLDEEETGDAAGLAAPGDRRAPVLPFENSGTGVSSSVRFNVCSCGCRRVI